MSVGGWRGRFNGRSDPGDERYRIPVIGVRAVLFAIMAMKADLETNEATSEGQETVWDVVIVGGGPAGATAALYAARAGWRTLALDKGIGAGALGMATRITNYPGIAGTVPGMEVVERIRSQASGFGASFVSQRVTAAALSETSKTVYAGRDSYVARTVIVATGSMGRSQSIPGEAELTGRGVSYCATCDGFFFRDQDVAVVGNRDEAIEEALHVARFARRVWLLCPTSRPLASPDLIEQAEQSEVIHTRTGCNVRKIVGERSVEGVDVESGGKTETIPVTGAFLYLQGGQPILEFLGGQLALTDSGCLQVDAMLQTSVPGVFAAGDVLCKHVKQAVIAAAEGAQAAVAADRYLSGRASLKPDWS